jgi:hypothetical protein
MKPRFLRMGTKWNYFTLFCAQTARNLVSRKATGTQSEVSTGL